MRNYLVSVRPWFHCQNRETHGGTVRLDRYGKHVSVNLLIVNKQSVSCSFVCQFIIHMLFAPSHDDTEQFVKFLCQNPNERQSAMFSPTTAPCGLRIAQMSGQFSWSRRHFHISWYTINTIGAGHVLWFISYNRIVSEKIYWKHSHM